MYFSPGDHYCFVVCICATKEILLTGTSCGAEVFYSAQAVLILSIWVKKSNCDHSNERY